MDTVISQFVFLSGARGIPCLPAHKCGAEAQISQGLKIKGTTRPWSKHYCISAGSIQQSLTHVSMHLGLVHVRLLSAL